MTLGGYESASSKKNRLGENKEKKKVKRNWYIPEFHPRWFTKEIEEATGEKEWKLNHKHWKEKECVDREKKNVKHCDKQMQVDRPPPPNVSEQQYIWLSILATKCYFCDAEVKNNEALRWEFKILICESCLVEKTISFEDLKKTDRYPDEMFRCLPYVEHIKHPSINQSFLPPRLTFTDINVDNDVNNDSKDAANNSDIFINENSYFLEKDVNKFLEEYNNFTVSLLRDECIEEKKKSLREYMKAIQERKKEEARKLTKEIVFYHIGRMGGRSQ
ncbi:6129_t:CDS:2 [Entrophospora sp. SA101]|nr:6129_t:CDS:2 [Entrophospora sp. SA101]CAJ0832637.1 16338_t:CDS:2 [Entrophospora sp. SA101]